MNYPLISAFTAIFFAQAIKYPIAFFSKKSPKIEIMTSTGGMPSSHSAAVASLITSLIFEYGFSSPLVAIATVFGVIIMFDSMGVRRQSGEQGLVIDALIRQINNKEEKIKQAITESRSEELTNPTIDENALDRYEDLVITKYLGHTPTEVFAGVLTGGLVAVIIRYLYVSIF